jgi:zinc protease
VMQPSILHRFLSNGMEVYLEHSNLAPLACLQVWVKTGSLDEEENEAGLAHVVEHMLFKGTPTFPEPGQIAQTVESVGGEINAFTKFENTVYQMTIPSSFTEQGTKILLDILFSSSFDEHELHREREVIIEELRRLRDHPGSIASLNLFSEMYSKTRMERPIIGFEPVIKDAPHELIKSFYQRWYIPNNMVFVATGNFDPQALLGLLEQISANIAPKPAPVRYNPILDVSQKTFRPVRIERGPWQEARVQFGCPAPKLESPEAPLWHMFASLLGSGDSSRLTRVVHDDLQLVAAIDAGIFMPRHLYGMMTINYFGEAAKARDAATASVEELVRLANHGPSESEMSRVVNNMIADRIYAKESVEGLTNNAGFSLQTHLKLTFDEHYLTALQRVSASEIRNTARTVCNAIEENRATFSIAADEHAPSDFNEESFYRAATSPLKHGVMIAGWNPEASGFKTATSKINENVKQICIPLAGDRELHINWREVKRLPLVSATLAFQGGLHLENPAENGIAHITTELLTHGTDRQTYQAFVDELEDRAASVSAFSTHDLCGIQIDALAQHAPRVFEMALDCITRPALAQSEWERVRNDSLNALIAQKDNPMVRLRRLLSPMLFGEHVYGRHPLGTEESLNALTLPQVHSQLRRMLSAKKYVLSIAGDFDLGLFVDKVSREFQTLTDTLEPNSGAEWEKLINGPRPVLPNIASKRVAFEKFQREQAHLAIAFRAYPISDPRRMAVELGSTILGGQGGRLFMDLRDARSLAYALGTSHILQMHAGCHYAFIGTAAHKVQEAYEGLKDHIERLASQKVLDSELERARNTLLGARNIDSQYFHYQASQLAMSDLYGLDFDNFLHFDERVKAVTTDDIRNAYSDLLRNNPPVVAIIGPEETWRPDTASVHWKL